MFVCVSSPRLSIGTGRRCREGHWSNIQLTRVELSTPDAAIEIASEKVNAATLPHLGFGAGGVWKRRDEERRKRRAGRKTTLDKRPNDYNTGQPLDEQTTRKPKISPTEALGSRRRSGQGLRHEE